MSSGCNEFRDRASETGRWVDGENGDLVLAVADALFEFDDGEEVGARVAEEVGRRGSGDVLDVDH